jgi:hypothetical protein
MNAMKQDGSVARVMLLHLTDRAGDFWPQQVNLLVQAAQGEGTEGWVWLGEEPNDAGSRGEANHRGRVDDVDSSVEARGSCCGSWWKEMELCCGACGRDAIQG